MKNVALMMVLIRLNDDTWKWPTFLGHPVDTLIIYVSDTVLSDLTYHTSLTLTVTMNRHKQAHKVCHITLNLWWKNADALQTFYNHFNNLEAMERTPRINVILVWYWRFAGNLKRVSLTLKWLFSVDNIDITRVWPTGIIIIDKDIKENNTE